MQKPVVDLPQPDSPTSERVSPSMMVAVKSSKARTTAALPPKAPRRMGKALDRPLMVISGAFMRHLFRL
jgi:hypothetical protein